jgi:hypothetical protein
MFKVTLARKKLEGSKKFQTKKEAQKFVRILMKKYNITRHNTYYLCNFRKFLEITTNY